MNYWRTLNHLNQSSTVLQSLNANLSAKISKFWRPLLLANLLPLIGQTSAAAIIYNEDVLKSAIATRFNSAANNNKHILYDMNGVPWSEFWLGVMSDFQFNSFNSFDPHLIASSSVTEGEAIPVSEDLIFIGSDELKNSSDVNMNLTGSEYTKSINNTVSTTTTTGWKIGGSLEYSGELSIQLLNIGTKITVTGEYNASKADTQTTSVSQTYTAKAQTVQVPPHSTAYVRTYFSQVAYTGEYTVRSNLDGSDKIFARWNMLSNPPTPAGGIVTTRIFDVLYYGVGAIPAEIQLLADTQSINLLSRGVYKAVVGTKYTVDVEIRPNDPSQQNQLRFYTYDVQL